MNTGERRWRPGESELQDDSADFGERIPEWHRFLLAIECAKARGEVAPTFEQWLAREEAERAEPVA